MLLRESFKLALVLAGLVLVSSTARSEMRVRVNGVAGESRLTLDSTAESGVMLAALSRDQAEASGVAVIRGAQLLGLADGPDGSGLLPARHEADGGVRLIWAFPIENPGEPILDSRLETPAAGGAPSVSGADWQAVSGLGGSSTLRIAALDDGWLLSWPQQDAAGPSIALVWLSAVGQPMAPPSRVRGRLLALGTTEDRAWLLRFDRVSGSLDLGEVVWAGPVSPGNPEPIIDRWVRLDGIDSGRSLEALAPRVHDLGWGRSDGLALAVTWWATDDVVSAVSVSQDGEVSQVMTVSDRHGKPRAPALIREVLRLLGNDHPLVSSGTPNALGVPRVLAHSQGWWVAWSDADGRSVVLLDAHGEVSGRTTAASDAHVVGAWTLGTSLQLLELDARGRLSLVVYGYVPGPIPIDIGWVSQQDLALYSTGSAGAAVSLRNLVITVDGVDYLAWQLGNDSPAGFVSLGELGATSDPRDLELRAHPESDTPSPLEAALRRALR